MFSIFIVQYLSTCTRSDRLLFIVESKVTSKDMTETKSSVYRFRDDDEHTPRLAIRVKPTVQFRDYQTKGLAEMFDPQQPGTARSGVIVLPCGGGKTLVGVVAMALIKRRALILVTSTMAADHWVSTMRSMRVILKRACTGARDSTVGHRVTRQHLRGVGRTQAQTQHIGAANRDHELCHGGGLGVGR